MRIRKRLQQLKQLGLASSLLSNQVADERLRSGSSSIEGSTSTNSLQLKQEDGEKHNNTSILGATETGTGYLSKTVVPSKKRKDINSAAKMKPKGSNKCYQKRSRDELQEGNGNESNTNIGEGSRCSRANGRGWRCGQKTLVGYSLCEHHLCKGRLRNLKNTNVTKRTDYVANLSKNPHSSSQIEEIFLDEDVKDEKKSISLSNLLGQTMDVSEKSSV